MPNATARPAASPSRVGPETPPGALKSLADIPKQIKGGAVASVYWLFGEDDYLREELLRQMLDALLPARPGARALGLDVLDGAVVQVRELVSLAETYPMGVQRRVVVVRDPVFLAGGPAPNSVERLRLAADAHAANPARALGLFFKALDLPPAPLDSAEVRAKIAALRTDVARDAPDLLSFLDGTADLFEGVPLPAEADASETDALADWLAKGPPATTVLIFVSRGPVGPRTPLVRRIQAVGVLANVDSLRETTAKGRDPVELFVRNRLRRPKRVIQDEALALLRLRTADDLNVLVQELDKLVAYVGDRTSIDVEDVRQVVADSTESTVFALTDAFGARDLPQALHSVHRLLAHGEAPLMVHALLVRQVRLMLQARLLQEEGQLLAFSPNMSYSSFTRGIYGRWPQDVVALLPDRPALNLLKQKPYPAYLLLQQASNFTVAELRAAYDLLLQADADMKSAGTAPEYVLLSVVQRLVGAGRPPKPQRGARSA
jgi:DNA polymerase-3 subunit delta